jgi:hypothetical protein
MLESSVSSASSNRLAAIYTLYGYDVTDSCRRRSSTCGDYAFGAGCTVAPLCAMKWAEC